MANTDKKTLDLIALINKKKSEIDKAEKPNWKTNCSFSYKEGTPTDLVNIHVESNVMKLVSMASYLIDMEDKYKKAATFLEVEAPAFKWNGYPVSDWLEDIKARINKVQITNKKSSLNVLEQRLNQIVSPELRAQIELEEIARQLEG